MAIFMMREYRDYLCLTANTAGSTVKLRSSKSAPTYGVPSIEISTDGKKTRRSYTISSSPEVITLTSVGDKVYWRGNSGFFSNSDSDYIYFEMSGSISCSGEVGYLLNKNGTNSAVSVGSRGTFIYLFRNCPITNCPKLNFTEIPQKGFYGMFYYCTSLETLPKLYSTELKGLCYGTMFQGCSKIKLSTTQTGDYQTPYRIPIEGTGTTVGANRLSDMFKTTGGTFTGTPSINTTYYTSNTVI